MTATTGARTIGILNSTEDVIELLVIVLEDEGYATHAAYIPDFKRGRGDLATWLGELAPTAVLYDIPPPYDENWASYQLCWPFAPSGARSWHSCFPRARKSCRMEQTASTGLPLVLLPIAADMFDNARRCAALGVGRPNGCWGCRRTGRTPSGCAPKSTRSPAWIGRWRCWSDSRRTSCRSSQGARGRSGRTDKDLPAGRRARPRPPPLVLDRRGDSQHRDRTDRAEAMAQLRASPCDWGAYQAASRAVSALVMAGSRAGTKRAEGGAAHRHGVWHDRNTGAMPGGWEEARCPLSRRMSDSAVPGACDCDLWRRRRRGARRDRR